jgi:hypothetical protein
MTDRGDPVRRAASLAPRAEIRPRRKAQHTRNVARSEHFILPENPAQDAEMNRTFIMPVVRPGDTGAQCSFVMEGIPTSTLAGQAGTAAAEAQNPETGKAL